VPRVQELRAAVSTYKFLRAGSIGPFTGYRWEPGRWVEADVAAPCERGVHACRVDDLPFWANDELWAIELDGAILTAGHKVVAPRGRLVRRVEAWTAATSRRFGDEAAARARGYADAKPRDRMLRGYAEDAERRAGEGRANAATFIAAVAAEHAGGPPGREAERDAQADWFRRLLGAAS
jgi:hypothetical protein